MARSEHRSFSAEQKFKILCEYLFKGTAISDVCQKYEIAPSQFYQWQKALMDNGSLALERKKSMHNESLQVKKMGLQIDRLKAEIQLKNNTLADLMYEHIELKKKWNGES
jgi:transposase-like protein